MFLFKIGNDELKVHAKDPFGDGNELIIYLSRKVGTEWENLAFPSIYATQVTTKESTDLRLNQCIAVINTKIKELYGAGAVVPDNGFERIRYVLSNLISFQDNKIVY